MHIAICDDNIADRKQTERLLERESDRRIHTDGVLYIDSYGKQESVLASPMLYDMFFIDMANSQTSTASDIVKALLSLGVIAPIVMLISSIDYQKDEYLASLEQVHFLEKPIRVADLSEIISMGFEIKNKKTPTVELRSDVGATYVKEKDIMYALYFNNQYTDVYLTDGRKIHMPTSIENFYAQLEHFGSFFPANKHTIIQIEYVKKFSLLHVQLNNGKKFSFPPDYRRNAKSILSL